MSETSNHDAESSGSVSTLGPTRRGVLVTGDGPVAQDVALRASRQLSTSWVRTSAVELPAEAGKLHLAVGDPTSRLVLRGAGAERVAAVVVAGDDDEVNLEVVRLAVAAGVDEVVCRVRDDEAAARCKALGGQPVTEGGSVALALARHLPGVVATTTEVGLGQGEILQVRVMPGSLVVGRTIATIATRAYLVAAIYRDGELLVPHGDTVIRVGDRVLIVGEPDTLRAIADYFRLGGARFPHQFGRCIVVWDTSETPSVLAEAQQVARGTSMRQVKRVVGRESSAAPNAPDVTPVVVHESDAFAQLRTLQPGLWVVRPPAWSPFGSRDIGNLRRLLRRAVSPVLLSRGSWPYRRILVAVSDTEAGWRGLELAVDVARIVGGEITALHVKQPAFLGGQSGEEAATKAVETVEQVAKLYSVSMHLDVVEGNPIRRVVEAAGQADLAVVAHTPHQRDNYFDPDIGLRIALGVPCSALLLPAWGRSVDSLLTGPSP